MSERDVLIGIDAGTSVIKAVAFDLSGHEIGQARRRNSYKTLPDGGVEQDMRRTWSDTLDVLKELTETVPDLAGRVLAASVTGQGDGTWLIDADGEPTHHGWLWLDARAAREARDIEASDGISTIYAHTATGVNVCQMRTHLIWMKRHSPELLSKSTTAFHCKDWLYFKLTDVRASDPTEAGFTFGNYKTGEYSDEVLEALDLSEQKALLPPIIDGSRHSDRLTDTAARQTGLPEGLPVCLGQVDVMCCAIGAGLHDPKVRPGLSVMGSTGMHMRFVPDAASVVLNSERSGYTMPFPGPAATRSFAQMQTNMAATLNIDWVLGLATQVLASQGIQKDTASLIEGLDALILAARPGAALYHPYISAAGERGPFAEPDARASFTGLDQNTDWFDMLRAVYDGLVLASRDCFDVLGERPGEIRVAGGAARSGALRDMLSAALRAPVRAIAQPEAGAAGAAMIAAVQQGLFKDITEATQDWVGPLLEPAVLPDPTLANTYDALFDAYLTTRTAMQPIWQSLAQARERMQ